MSGASLRARGCDRILRVRRRFFVERFEANRCVLEGKSAHHLGRVLRAQPGQLYELSDGRHVWLGRIEKAGRDRVEFSLVEALPAPTHTLSVALLLAVVKFDHFEWALEKATELDAAAIVPLAAARCEKALLTAAPKRAERWKKILLEASQQSRRVKVPALEPLAKPGAAFQGRKEALRLLFSERPNARALRRVLPGAYSKSAALAFGPEGGWTDEEIAAAQKAGFEEVGLGKLILRTETAVAAALAALHYALGED